MPPPALLAVTRRVLVVGAGRSGTQWSAAEITAVTGQPCGHEQAYTLDRHGPATAHEVSWLAAPYLARVDRDATAVVWLLRDPAASVASLVARGMFRPDTPDRWTRFACEPVDVHPAAYESPVVAAAAWWIRWARMIAAHQPDTAVWLEDLATAGWGPTLAALDVIPETPERDPLPPRHATRRRRALATVRASMRDTLVRRLRRTAVDLAGAPHDPQARRIVSVTSGP